MDEEFALTPEILVPRLGDHLVERGLISSEQLQKALQRQESLRQGGVQSPLLGQILLDLGFIDRSTLDRAITEQIVAYRTALQEANQQLEERVKERTAELEFTLHKLSNLTQLKANFVSNISHELRTPLTHLKGYLELITSGDLGKVNEEQNQALAIMSRSCDRLERLIDDLILFSLLERGEATLNIHPFSLLSICQLASQRYAQVAAEHDLTFEIECDQPVPSILGDEEKILWVVQQLVDNAIKFTQPSGKVILQIKKDGSLVTISVIDDGIGIPPDRLQEIFEPFHQLDGSSTRRYGGTGLGLALAQVIVRSHGSEIYVKSTLQHGSTFSFTLQSSET